MTENGAVQSFEHSESIGKLMLALAKARKAFKPAFKDRDNPAFRSKYVPLENLIDATFDALCDNELAVMQLPTAGSTERSIALVTILGHSSGEWISSKLELPATMRERLDAQTIGSGLTYARRYALQSVLNIAGEVDDDGNAASDIGSKEAAQAVARKKIANYEEKAAASVKEKIVYLSKGTKIDNHGAPLPIVYFEASEALAILLEAGLNAATTYDKDAKMRWVADIPVAMEAIQELAGEHGIKLVRRESVVVSPPVRPAAKPEVANPLNAASGPIIESCSDLVRGKKSVFFTVTWQGHKMSCFHADWHPYIKEAVGKPAVFMTATNGQYVNLDEVVSIDGNSWHEGRPTLQQELR